MDINRISDVSPLKNNTKGMKPRQVETAITPKDTFLKSVTAGASSTATSSKPGKPAKTVGKKIQMDIRDSGFLFQEEYAPEVKWTVKGIRDRVDASPLVDEDGAVYFGTSGYNFYKVDQDGNILWKEHVGGNVHSRAVKDIKNNVLVASTGNKIFAFSPDGEAVWSFRGKGSMVSSPAVDEKGNVYAPCCDNNLYCLSHDGELQWRHECEGSPSTPVFDEKGNAYFGDVWANLTSVDSEVNVRWTKKLDEDAFEAPTIGKDGRLYYGDSGGNVTCFNPENGEEIWKTKTGWAISSSPHYTKRGDILVTSQDGHLYCLDAKKGEKQWAFKADDYDVTEPIENETGNIYLAGKNKIYCVSPDGLPLWKKEFRFKEATSSMALSNDKKTLYVGLDRGGIMALKRNDKAEDIYGKPSDGDGPEIIDDGNWIIIDGVKLPKKKSLQNFMAKYGSASLAAIAHSVSEKR